MDLAAFLSTLSLRRATKLLPIWSARTTYFYPRSPCGERRLAGSQDLRPVNFYPRSPCGERPLCVGINSPSPKNFYPRSPCGERPNWNGVPRHADDISIHALLAESDSLGVRYGLKLDVFLSTLSLRRATVCGAAQFGWQ